MRLRCASLDGMDVWPALLALIGVAVGGVIARVGEVLGFFNERKHWQRQQRLAAYTQFFQEYDRVTVALTLGLRTAPVDGDRLAGEFAEMAGAQASAASAVAVIGPPEVYKSVQGLLMKTLSKSAEDIVKATSGETIVDEDKTVADARDWTLAAMQKALR